MLSEKRTNHGRKFPCLFFIVPEAYTSETVEPGHVHRLYGAVTVLASSDTCGAKPRLGDSTR